MGEAVAPRPHIARIAVGGRAPSADALRGAFENARAGRSAGRRIDFAIEVRTSFNNEILPVAFGQSDRRNGLFAAVMSKAP